MLKVDAEEFTLIYTFAKTIGLDSIGAPQRSGLIRRFVKFVDFATRHAR